MLAVELLDGEVLAAVRQRLGAEDGGDSSFDELVAKLSPREVVAAYAGWVLGDESWGRKILRVYDSARSAEVEG